MEPIEVIASFSQGRITPHRLRWNGRVYSVDEVNRHWVYRDGRRTEHHFAVRVQQTDFFELCLHLPDMNWTLDRVAVG